MSTDRSSSVIRLRGVRQNNLKNIDLDLPVGRLIVVTGLSGSGKSSLAFDTLYAEGQRRYIETFSPYARQFFDRMDKPQVDSVSGIPPAIAIEQTNSVRSTRSTVATMTEIADYMKVLWPHFSQLHCRQCGSAVHRDSPQEIWQRVRGTSRRTEGRVAGALVLAERMESMEAPEEAIVTFDLALAEGMALSECLALIERQGYQRLWIDGNAVRLEEAARILETRQLPRLSVVQDRVRIGEGNRSRFIEACEQAYHFGKGQLAVRLASEEWRFSQRLHCAQCDLAYESPTTALFSFNHPVGACAACRGFGRVITLDLRKAIPDPSKTLREGAVRPWQSGQSAECQDDLMKFCKKRGCPTDVPFRDLPKELQDWVIQGDANYENPPGQAWPRAWYGVRGFFRWLESKAYKMHVRVLLSRYRAYQRCHDCHGRRFKPETLLYRVAWKKGSERNRLARPDGGTTWTLADFYGASVDEAAGFIQVLAESDLPVREHDPLRLALGEVMSRLHYLQEAGLGYLTLDRATRTLSGGETERVNLTTCLGSRLVNTLFVLDEPSVGLHPRDTERLVKILQRLKARGNTVVVVEHEVGVMAAADEIVDLGPGRGEHGGQVMFQGSYPQLVRSKDSVTGRFLRGETQVGQPSGRKVTKETAQLRLRGVSKNNLKNLDVQIPLGRLVCVTGVSGSGKSTLVRDVLYPAVAARHGEAAAASAAGVEAGDMDEAGVPEVGGELAMLEGAEFIQAVTLVDQSPIGRTPRSTPIVYLDAFGEVRKLFAKTPQARRLDLREGLFSFNSRGQCPRCRGAGFEKIEMQFLSDVYVRCPDCQGKRYLDSILEIKLENGEGHAWNIAELLDASVEEVVQFLKPIPEAAARAAVGKLEWLCALGLGYLRAGQPINTLSGGEAQRLKLVARLVESRRGEGAAGRTLFILDEPTTGLHLDDVRLLLHALQELVDQGHSVLVVEHNLELIRCADWIIDLGPEAGAAGGEMVVAGTVADVEACAASHTGRALGRGMGTKKAK